MWDCAGAVRNRGDALIVEVDKGVDHELGPLVKESGIRAARRTRTGHGERPLIRLVQHEQQDCHAIIEQPAGPEQRRCGSDLRCRERLQRRD